jgi:hypothetical protein
MSRDPQMHQTKKGNQCYFGMKAHIDVDAESGLVHTVTGTAANAADVTETHALLHGEKTAPLSARRTKAWPWTGTSPPSPAPSSGCMLRCSNARHKSST